MKVTEESVILKLAALDRAAMRRSANIPAGDAETARKHPTFVAGDSALIVYRNTEKSLPTNDFPVFTSWGWLKVSIGVGYTPRSWWIDLGEFIREHEEMLEDRPGGGKENPTVCQVLCLR